jgi:Protein kinase domain
MKAIPSMSAEAAKGLAPAECETESPDRSSRQSLRSAIDLSAWLDCRRATQIALSICAALDEAQQGGAPLLGLNPENIFINDDDQAFISQDEIYRDTAPRLAAQYLSPEELRGDSVDARSALYALGVVLYEMLTDRVPFDDSDAEVIKQKHLHKTPEPPNVFRADVPDRLSHLVMRLLEKDPARRPQSAADLFIELEQMIEVETDRTNSQSLSDATSSDILTLADFASTEFCGEPANASDDAVLDLEFNDLFGVGVERVAALNEQPAESFDAAPQLPTASLRYAKDQKMPPHIAGARSASHEQSAVIGVSPDDPTTNRELDIKGSENLRRSTINRIERDPFDVSPGPVIEPLALNANSSARPKPAAIGARVTKEKPAIAEAGDPRLRWLALLLMGMVLTAAVLLYKLARPAETKPIDPGPAAPASPAPPQAQQAAPNIPYSPLQPTPRSARGNRAKSAVAPAVRHVNGERKASPVRRTKHKRARRVRFYR